MTDTPGTLEERLRRNAGWRNERHQCVTDPNLLTEAADEIASLRARVEVMTGALEAIKAHATRLRAGTDDWFEMVEFQAFADQGLAALKETPDEG